MILSKIKVSVVFVRRVNHQDSTAVSGVFFKIFLVCGNFEDKRILKLHSDRFSFTFLFTRVLNDAIVPYVASNWAIIGVCASNTKI